MLQKTVLINIPHVFLFQTSTLHLSVDAHDLRVKDQGRPARDEPARARIAVAQGGRDLQLAHLAHARAQQALVPPFDDLAGAQGEVEGGAPVAGGVELGAVQEGAGVVDGDLVARLGRVKSRPGCRDGFGDAAVRLGVVVWGGVGKGVVSDCCWAPR